MQSELNPAQFRLADDRHRVELGDGPSFALLAARGEVEEPSRPAEAGPLYSAVSTRCVRAQ